MVRDERGRIQQGWSVIGSDGSEMGKVLEVHEGHLVVEGGVILKHNLYVPLSAVTDTADERVTVSAPAGDAEQLGWRFPPDAGLTPKEGSKSTEAASEPTTMTGAAYGAGAGVSSAGPLAPGHGDAIADRLGGSGRAGLSGLRSRPEDDVESLIDDDAGDGPGEPDGTRDDEVTPLT
jgi:hypothetical protein